MSVLAYHTTSTQAARIIAQQGFRIPVRASHSRTDAAGMGGSFFRTVFVTRKKPSWRSHISMPYGPALITVRIDGSLLHWQRRPGKSFVDDMHYAIRTAKKLRVAGVDSGRDDYGLWIVDPRAIRIISVEPYKYARSR